MTKSCGCAIIEVMTSDGLSYTPRLEEYPYGCEDSMLRQIVGEQLRKLQKHTGRSVNMLATGPTQLDLGDRSIVTPDDVLIGSTNDVMLTRRRIVAGGRKLLGICCLADPDKPAEGSLTVLTIPPNGIQGDYDLGRIETGLAHELFHSVGIGHCATKQCLMYPKHNPDDLYGMSTGSEYPFCGVHTDQLEKIA